MIIGYNECPRLASLASTLVLPVFPGASARQVLAEASLTDLSRDGAEGIPNYVEQKQNPHDFRHRGFVLALPILPGRCQPSIVSRDELNYRVRNGNGWTLILISTNSMSSSTARKQTILYCFASYLSRPFSDLSYISIEKPASAFRDGKGKAAEGISFRACAEANAPQLALTW